jgi:hypothetical protein
MVAGREHYATPISCKDFVSQADKEFQRLFILTTQFGSPATRVWSGAVYEITTHYADRGLQDLRVLVAVPMDVSYKRIQEWPIFYLIVHVAVEIREMKN